MSHFTQKLQRFAEHFTPVQTRSNFYETGKLTPDEFVQAGDELVATCGTWRWAPAASPKYFRNYLPKEKQYLIARKIPSMRRVDDMKGYDLGDPREIIEMGD